MAASLVTFTPRQATSTYAFTDSSNTMNDVITVEDAGQELTSDLTYDGVGPGATSYGYDPTDTLLTSVTLPSTPSGVALTQQYGYDSNTGLMVSATDFNGQQTTYAYDSLLRGAETINPDSGRTMVGYSATQIAVFAYQNSSTYTDSETLLDPLGRASRFAVSNGQAANPWYQTDTCYNPSALSSFTSYEYQGSGWGVAPVCSGAGDTVSYDPLGRVTGITHGDGTSISYSYGGREPLACAISKSASPRYSRFSGKRGAGSRAAFFAGAANP
jgi:YD repeat-containing protein